MPVSVWLKVGEMGNWILFIFISNQAFLLLWTLFHFVLYVLTDFTQCFFHGHRFFGRRYERLQFESMAIFGTTDIRSLLVLLMLLVLSHCTDHTTLELLVCTVSKRSGMSPANDLIPKLSQIEPNDLSTEARMLCRLIQIDYDFLGLYANLFIYRTLN